MSKLSTLMQRYSTLQIFCLLVTFTGICLAVLQFFLNRSLWFDEAALAINFVEKDYSQLFGRLHADQVAPICFLLIEKTATILFGNNEMALRFFPLICYLGSIPLVFGFARNIFSDKNFAYLSVATFSITNTIIRYSSEVKQYSTDVLVGLFVLYSVTAISFSSKKNCAYWAVLGLFIIWLSNISIIVLAVVGVYVLKNELLSKKNFLPIFSMMAWAISFGTYYLIFVRNHPSRGLMLDYWNDSFLPLNPFSEAFVEFGISSLKGIYGWTLGFGPIWFLPFSISLVGLWSLLIEKKWRALYLLGFPILLHLGLSSLKLYPFASRLILYLSPAFIIMFVVGSERILDLLTIKIRFIPNTFRIAPVLLFMIPLYVKYPNKKEEIKDSLQFMKENIQEKDHIYLYCSASMAYRFYKSAGIFEFKNEMLVGNMHRENNQRYLEDLKHLKGRTWLVFSHVFPFDEKVNEETFIINALKKSNNTFLLNFKTTGSSVYLVDLK